MDNKDITRRGFIMAGTAAAGFALAARPIGAETILTPADGLTAGWISFAAADGPVKAYRARPAAPGRAPVVLVAHEIFGVHEYIQDVCRRLARAGYLAIAPDLFQRQGDVSVLGSIPEIIEQVVNKVPDAQVFADLDAAAAWADSSGEGDIGRLAITGFCWGGRFAWVYSAHNPAVRAAAAWYGRLLATGPGVLTDIGEGRTYPLSVADKLHGPVLGLYGGKDGSIPQDTIRQMREALAAAKDPSEIVVYPDAAHGFHADYRAALYNEAAARDGWQRMLDWFARYAGGKQANTAFLL